MESGKEHEANIIIIKKGHKHEGHHGGAWKVAYADFVTAMMAFFLVMWLVGQSDRVKESVGGYFRDPVGFTGRSGAGVLDGQAEQKPKDEEVRRRHQVETEKRLAEAGKAIVEAFEDLGLSEMSDRIEVEMTDEGLRIQLMETGDSTFFDLGSATLASSGTSVIAAVGQVIAPLNYDVILEGHTDSRQYVNSGAYTNWELSSDRANTARRLLEQNGVAPERFAEIRGFASNQLRYPENPEDPRNRRIAIVVINPFATPLEARPSVSALLDSVRPDVN
ncbi:MAG: flagellar motor protein MotB [Candidatus Zixiibacteriota bacterium]